MMSTTDIPSRHDAERWLLAACERQIGYLRDLTSIHLTFDPIDRMVDDSEPEDRLRLRKTLLHVLAVTSWGVDTEVLHVMAPEIRAAKKQLEPVFSKHLDESNDGVDKAGENKLQSQMEKLLEPFAHPTPMVLISGRDQGGLGQADDIVCLYQLFTILSTLIIEYGLCLGIVVKELDGSCVPGVLDVFERSSIDLGSMSPPAFLQFVKR